jgi:hypothetical protein
MYRRLALAITIVWLDFKISILQIVVSALLSIAVLAYLFRVYPMKKRYHNVLAIYNEVFVYTGCLMMIAFTDYMRDPEVRYELGYVFIYWIAAALLTVNFTVLVYDIAS